MPCVRLLTRLVLGTLAVPCAVAAQDTAAVSVGDRVRLRVRPDEGVGRAARCEARVTAVAGDTLTVANASRWGGCPRQAYAASAVASMEVARGHRGSRLLHTGVGLLGGAVGGGVFGWALADRCDTGGCSEGDLAAAVFTFTGIVLGGLTGTIVGAALPAGPRWVTAPAGAPVRVAGLALRPSVRWVGSRPALAP